MNKTRLLKLARFLEKSVPPEKFDMGTWGESSKVPSHAPVCVTKACALGWATAIPEFKGMGLYLEQAWADSNLATVKYLGHEDATAGRIFFGLTHKQTSRLFLHGADDPKMKAAQIRKMVRDAA